MSIRVDHRTVTLPSDVEWVRSPRHNAVAHAVGRCYATRGRLKSTVPAKADWRRCDTCVRSTVPRDCPGCGVTFIAPMTGGRQSDVCPVCLESWYQDLIHDRTTMVAIADRIGVTDSAIQWLIGSHYPDWRQAQEAVRLLRDLAVACGRRCRTCGGQLPSNKPSYCSDRCVSLAEDLHHATRSEALLRAHMLATARWSLANVDPDSVAYRQRVGFWRKAVEGRWDEVDSHGRWLVVGSAAFDAAVEVVERGWPLADELHPDVRAQVEEHLDECMWGAA